MCREDLLDCLTAAIREVTDDDRDLSESSPLTGGGVDSLELMIAWEAVERRCGRKLAKPDPPALVAMTVGDLLDHIQAQLAA